MSLTGQLDESLQILISFLSLTIIGYLAILPLMILSLVALPPAE